MRLHNLTILGTSHIARQSLKEVRDAIEDDKPDVVALELDRQRFLALMSNAKKRKSSLKDIKKIGVKGFLFSIFGEWAERKLGEQVGVKPGSEMKLAGQLAAIHKIPVILIDQNIAITLKKFSKALTWKEKWNFVVDIFNAIIFRKKSIPFDLASVPTASMVKKLTKEVKVRYPNIYYVLVEERNEIMAKRLAKLMKQDPNRNILAVMGAGHESDVIKIIKKELK
ncbi:MAG: TraB/GumN family protein [Candidatus Nanoarchaeia archaeon]